MASSVASSTAGTVRGSTQYLWNLIQRRVVVLSEDVVTEELKDNLDRVVAGLTYYGKYTPEEDETPVKFDTATKFMKSVHKSLEENSRAETNKQNEGNEEKSPFQLVRRAVAQKLNIRIEVVTELIVSYMMYEYKGQKISWEEISETNSTFERFLGGLRKYYRQERFCLLLCTQAILADVGDDNYKFFSVVESIRTNITYKKWCWGLLRSFALAQDDEETVEIFHSLTLLMYKLPNETIPEFFTYFTKNGFNQLRKSEQMKLAEGGAMYAALTVSGITDCCNGFSPEEFSKPIADFLEDNFVQVMGNAYNYAPVLAAIEIFCKENQCLKMKLKRISYNVADTFRTMQKLAEFYEKDSLRDRHSLSVVICASIFEAFEALVAGYDISHFGSCRQAFLVFASILKHNLVAENFLTGTPLALSGLYTDATTLFPLNITSSLHLWKSLCMSVRSQDVCNTIVKGVAKMQCVAEDLSDNSASFIRRTGSFKVENVVSRSLYGYTLEAGVTGNLTTNEGSDCVVWCLPTTAEWSAFEVLRFVTQLVANDLEELRKANHIQIDYSDFNYFPDELNATATFLIEFWKRTDDEVQELKELLFPVCSIMETMIRYKSDVGEKARLITDLLGLVTAVNEFSADVTLFNYIYDAIPGSEMVGVVEDILLGREGYSKTEGDVGLAFLNMISSFAEGEKFWKSETRPLYRAKFLKCIEFIGQNIVPTCAKWRLGAVGMRNELCLKCLQIFIHLYSKENLEFLALKRKCAKFLLAPTSCLVAVLQTVTEKKLHVSVIRPTEDTTLYASLMNTSLKLLLRLMRFDIETFKILDEAMEGSMIRLLGGMFRHRLIPSIPTLVSKILKEVGYRTGISLLTCFGSDEAAFRDVIIQRLELPSEDINLKVAVLEFVTIVAQTQDSLIECFFNDGILENNIVDLMQDNDDLAVASLGFFRSLFIRKLPLPSACHDFWHYMMSPIHRFSKGNSIKVITYTLHIIMFEMFKNGLSDQKMAEEVEHFFASTLFRHVVEAAVNDESDERANCVTAIKHFFTLILGRSELTHIVPKETFIHLQTIVLDKFWELNPKQKPKLITDFAELACLLTIPDSVNKELMQEFLLNMIEKINDHSLGTRLALFCLLNKFYNHYDDALNDGEVEKTLRIIRQLLDYCIKYIEDKEDHPNVNMLIAAATSILTTIIEKQHINVWGSVMNKELIPYIIVSLASAAITRKKNPDVVSYCITALISLADEENSCVMVPWHGLSKTLYLQLYRFIFTDPSRDPAWDDILVMCVHMNSALLRNLRHDFLDEALAFWGFYAEQLNKILVTTMDVSRICVGVDDPDKGYMQMKTILTSASFTLNCIHTMTYYVKQWTAVQPLEAHKAISSVFYILQEVTSLLKQPYLLQTCHSSKPKQSCIEYKVSPRLVEMQAKLFHISNISLQIIVAMKTTDLHFFELHALFPVIFHISPIVLKSLHGLDKKSPETSFTRTSLAIIEKIACLVYMYSLPILDNGDIDEKQQTTFRREHIANLNSLCEGIRRIPIPISQYLVNMCSNLDEQFK